MSEAAESIQQDDSNKATVVEEVKSTALEDKEVQDAPAPELSPRQQIYKNFDKNNRNKSDEDAPEQEPEEEVDALEEESDEAAESDDAPEMVEVKINGKVREVEKSKVDAAGGIEIYQKGVAANEKLQEAADANKLVDGRITELRELEDRIKNLNPALPAKDEQQDQDPPSEIDGDLKAKLATKVKEHREALMDGEEDKADQLMIEMVEMAQNRPATDSGMLDQLADKAASKAVGTIEQQRFEESRVKAVEVFEKDFFEISSDPYLRDMADNESAKVQQEHPNWTPQEVITEAATRTQNWLNEKRGGSEDSTERTKDQKLEAKRSLSTVRSSSGRKPAQVREKPTQSNSDYIKQLRKGRGLD